MRITITRNAWIGIIVALAVIGAIVVWMFSYQRNGGSGREIGALHMDKVIFENGWKEEVDDDYSNYYTRKAVVTIEGSVTSGKLEFEFRKQDGTVLATWSYKAGDEVDVERTFTGLKEEYITTVYRYTKDYEGDIYYSVDRYCYGMDLSNPLIY